MSNAILHIENFLLSDILSIASITNAQEFIAMIPSPSIRSYAVQHFSKYLIFSLILVVGILFYQRSFISDQINSYALKNTQEILGEAPVSAHQEEFIRKVAAQMNVQENFLVRKMSQPALLAHGYCNAFACFPLLFNCIPTGAQPLLFISEGFFEDLTLQEQRFIIGHELTHIKEHHTQYLSLWIIVVQLLVLFFLWILFRWYVTPTIKRKCTNKKQRIAIYATITFIIFAITELGATLVQKQYLRDYERVADHYALTTLNCHDGCLALIKRWQSDYQMPSHNAYYGLFSDHPSCVERKNYCLQLQAQQKDYYVA